MTGGVLLCCVGSLLIEGLVRLIERFKKVLGIACKIKSDQDKEIYLPDDIVIEILSRLPVQSLGRCKCVCKQWFSVIEHPKLITEHLGRSRCVYQYGEKTDVNDDQEIFKHIRGKNGILVEKSNVTGKFRLRNPTTKHILDLPDPHGKGFHVWLFYISNSNNLKLVDVYCQEGTEHGGFQFLTVGTDLAWRSINCPSIHNLGGKEKSISSLGIGEVLFVTRFFNVGSGLSEVVCLEVESEHFVHVKIPQAFLSSLNRVKSFAWEQKFCLANLVEQEFHVCIFDDYKKRKWAERKIAIPLTLFGKYPKTLDTLSPIIFANDWLWFRRCDDSHIAYNIRTKLEHIKSPPPGKRFLYEFIPSLVSLKGSSRCPEEKFQGKEGNCQESH